MTQHAASNARGHAHFLLYDECDRWFSGNSQRIEFGDSDGHDGSGGEAGGRLHLLPARHFVRRFFRVFGFAAAPIKTAESSLTPPISSSGLELPGINYKFNTKKYRYFYGSRVEMSPHPNKVEPTRTNIFITLHQD